VSASRTTTRARGQSPRSVTFRKVVADHAARTGGTSIFGVPIADMSEPELRAMLVWACEYVAKMRRMIEGAR